MDKKFDQMKRLFTLSLYLAISKMKARYRKTIAGFIWVVMGPIIVFSVQSVVFKYILKIDIQNYSLFLLGGLLPWVFISSMLDMGIPSLVASEALLKGFKLHPSILIISQAIDNFVNFLFSYFLLLIPTLVLTKAPLEGIIFIPLSVLLLLWGGASLTWCLAILNVFYRDVKFVINFFMGVLFFLTPIAYPISAIPENYRWIVDVNIIYGFIAPIRHIFYNFSINEYFYLLLKGFVFASALTFVSFIYWRRRRNEFYAYLN